MSDELRSHLEFIQISTSEIIAVKKQQVARGMVEVIAETRESLHTSPNPLGLADFPNTF
jgi:hypothetical protein